MATIVECVKIIWGGSLFAIVALGVACALSPTTRARLSGSEAPLRPADRHDG